jgi:lysophospholipase L1-like esterase
VYNFYVRKSTKTFGNPSRPYRYFLEHSELFFRSNDLLQAYFQGSPVLHDFPDWYQYNYQKLMEVKQLAEEYGFECLFIIYGHSGQPGNYAKIAEFNKIFKHSIDLTNELVQAKDQPIWFDAIHTNAAGHRLIAKRIYEYIMQHGLLKAAQPLPSARPRE